MCNRAGQKIGDAWLLPGNSACDSWKCDGVPEQGLPAESSIVPWALKFLNDAFFAI